MTLRFLHTSDWQLGMPCGFLSDDARALYANDQFAAVRRLARIADERECAFVVVAGDVFDSFQPDRRTLSRAVEALGEFRVPVYLLPGNHDPCSPAALWSRADFADRLPSCVTVLRDAAAVLMPGTDTEVVGVPWPSKRPAGDMVERALAGLDVLPSGRERVVVAHGAVEGMKPEHEIALAPVENALRRRACTYVALGDRHSTTAVGGTGAAWYSGAPLATAYGETDPNAALVVKLDGAAPQVERVEVGAWHFLDRSFEIAGDEGVDGIERFLDALPQKERTAVKLVLSGSITVSANARLEDLLERSRDLFAALRKSRRRSTLAVVADHTDLDGLGLSGFALAAARELAAVAGGDTPEATVAADALMLLHRLVALP